MTTLTNLTPEQRILRARMGAYAAFAKHGRHAMTEAARAANPSSESYWLRKIDEAHNEVDPDHPLPDGERRRRAADAKTAHFAGLALKSAIARRDRTRTRSNRANARSNLTHGT
jgi:hypothetical protein